TTPIGGKSSQFQKDFDAVPEQNNFSQLEQCFVKSEQHQLTFDRPFLETIAFPPTLLMASRIFHPPSSKWVHHRPTPAGELKGINEVDEAGHSIRKFG
ncbi:hypothetical protein AVEN_231365-1, partial [Araneus ventricosus]